MFSKENKILRTGEDNKTNAANIRNELNVFPR